MRLDQSSNCFLNAVQQNVKWQMQDLNCAEQKGLLQNLDS
jgi:hypothetical protein